MKPSLRKVTIGPLHSFSVRKDQGAGLVNNWHYHPEVELLFIKGSKGSLVIGDHIGNFPHHGGHGVGTVYHEEPRIVPYNNSLLEPNMVIALEPAIYKEDYGIRLEHLVVVTETGCEILTNFQHRFEENSLKQ